MTTTKKKSAPTKKKKPAKKAASKKKSAPKTLKVGDKAPSAFTIVDRDTRKDVEGASLAGRRRVLFFAYFDVPPRLFYKLKPFVDELAAVKGVHVALIMKDTFPVATMAATKNTRDYLDDYSALGVPYRPMATAYGINRGTLLDAIFVVDETDTIVHVQTGDQRTFDRDAALAAVRSLKK